MKKEEVRGSTNARRLRMRKNPVYVYIYSRIVLELLGQVPFLRILFITRFYMYNILASSNYRRMQYVAYIYTTTFSCAIASMCNFEQPYWK